LNDLRCPETVAQSVDVLWFITAGDDFEFQVPTALYNVAGPTYTPQSNREETIVNTGIAESKIHKQNHSQSTKSIGEHFLSVKQLLNKNSQIQPFNTDTFSTTNIIVYPYAITGSSNNGAGLLANEAWAADAYSYIAPMYNYFRGKARVAVISDTSNNFSFCNIPNLIKNISSSSWISTVTASFSLGQNVTVPVTVNKTKVPFQTPVPTGTNNGFAFQQVPYQNKFPVSFTQVWSGLGANFWTVDETIPTASACFSAGSNFGTTTTIQRSFCDDFQLLFFIGCPPLFVSTT